MGRKSTRKDKNIYQVSRENAGLTRESASEAMGYVTADRIEKIEYETSTVRPDEVLAMARAYGVPALCNYYCSNECEIGRKYVEPVEVKDIAQLTLEALANINALTKQKDRLVEIMLDGQISEEEKPDFRKIKALLNNMSKTIDALKLWAEQNAPEE